MEKQAMHALSAAQLGFRYPDQPQAVFEDLTLAMPSGRVTAILGPNGSGKTTLLDLFLGLLQPTGGRLSVFERERRTYSEKQIRRLIGLVPQSETIPFDLSLLEYVLLGRAPFLGIFSTPGATDRAIALQAIEQVGLSALTTRAVPSMSGGERQLAAVARALAQESHIVLMDEPTSHLDLANARRILALMTRISEQGRSVVFTTHDPNAAAAVANHVILLKNRRLLAQGAVADTLTEPLLSATYGQPIEVVHTHRGPWVLTYATNGHREGRTITS
jgi:iron complex transport system ATP-binding protein